MSSLQEWLEKTVSVITSDGRNIIGRLLGFDQVQNLVLSESHERIFSEDKGVVQAVLGLYVIRGDTIVLIGEIDEDRDSQMDLSSIKAAPLKPIAH